MGVDAFKPVRDFEAAICAYTGAPYAVATNSCSMALLLAVRWHFLAWDNQRWIGVKSIGEVEETEAMDFEVEIPKRTYLSVPMAICHAGGRPTFRDQDWCGAYQLKPLPVWDSARWFTGDMYVGGLVPNGMPMDRSGHMLCVSFHHSKTLGDTQGGAILLDDEEAARWLRRARFDGRTEGVPPTEDSPMLGWHCYLSPDVAARLMWKLSKLPRHNSPLPNDDYPDLSTLDIFK